MIVGYARVSTDGQTLDAQEAALAAAGAQRGFAEKVSGAVTDRKALARAIAACGPGDCLLGRVWIGSHARPGTSSTSSMRSAKPGRGLDR
jgi:Resolvase, N terminal domain